MGSSTQRVYTNDFKQGAVKLVLEQGRIVPTAAKELGISINTLYGWVRKYQQHGADAFPGKGHLMPQDEELRRLRKELADVTMERDILKKAMAVFSRHQR
jgi:transposase